MADEKILTQHPAGKSGRNISKKIYDMIKQAILTGLRSKELTHDELLEEVNQDLKDKFCSTISTLQIRQTFGIEEMRVASAIAAAKPRHGW